MDVALLTAVSALVVAALSGILQVWQLLVQHRLAQRQAANQQALDLSMESLRAHRIALGEISNALQKFQDELLLMSRAAFGTLLSSSKREHVALARDEFLASYRENHSALGSNEIQALLEVRKRVVDMVLMLDLEGVWSGEYLNLSEHHKEKIENALVYLANRHQQIIHSGLSRLQKFIETRSLNA